MFSNLKRFEVPDRMYDLKNDLLYRGSNYGPPADRTKALPRLGSTQTGIRCSLAGKHCTRDRSAPGPGDYNPIHKDTIGLVSNDTRHAHKQRFNDSLRGASYKSASMSNVAGKVGAGHWETASACLTYQRGLATSGAEDAAATQSATTLPQVRVERWRPGAPVFSTVPSHVVAVLQKAPDSVQHGQPRQTSTSVRRFIDRQTKARFTDVPSSGYGRGHSLEPRSARYSPVRSSGYGRGRSLETQSVPQMATPLVGSRTVGVSSEVSVHQSRITTEAHKKYRTKRTRYVAKNTDNKTTVPEMLGLVTESLALVEVSTSDLASAKPSSPVEDSSSSQGTSGDRVTADRQRVCSSDSDGSLTSSATVVPETRTPPSERDSQLSDNETADLVHVNAMPGKSVKSNDQSQEKIGNSSPTFNFIPLKEKKSAEDFKNVMRRQESLKGTFVNQICQKTFEQVLAGPHRHRSVSRTPATAVPPPAVPAVRVTPLPVGKGGQRMPPVKPTLKQLGHDRAVLSRMNAQRLEKQQQQDRQQRPILRVKKSALVKHSKKALQKKHSKKSLKSKQTDLFAVRRVENVTRSKTYLVGSQSKTQSEPNISIGYVKGEILTERCKGMQIKIVKPVLRYKNVLESKSLDPVKAKVQMEGKDVVKSVVVFKAKTQTGQCIEQAGGSCTRVAQDKDLHQTLENPSNIKSDEKVSVVCVDGADSTRAQCVSKLPQSKYAVVAIISQSKENESTAERNHVEISVPKSTARAPAPPKPTASCSPMKDECNTRKGNSAHGRIISYDTNIDSVSKLVNRSEAMKPPQVAVIFSKKESQGTKSGIVNSVGKYNKTLTNNVDARQVKGEIGDDSSFTMRSEHSMNSLKNEAFNKELAACYEKKLFAHFKANHFEDVEDETSTHNDLEDKPKSISDVSDDAANDSSGDDHTNQDVVTLCNAGDHATSDVIVVPTINVMQYCTGALDDTTDTGVTSDVSDHIVHVNRFERTDDGNMLNGSVFEDAEDDEGDTLDFDRSDRRVSSTVDGCGADRSACQTETDYHSVNDDLSNEIIYITENDVRGIAADDSIYGTDDNASYSKDDYTGNELSNEDNEDASEMSSVFSKSTFIVGNLSRDNLEAMSSDDQFIVPNEQLSDDRISSTDLESSKCSDIEIKQKSDFVFGFDWINRNRCESFECGSESVQNVNHKMLDICEVEFRGVGLGEHETFSHMLRHGMLSDRLEIVEDPEDVSGVKDVVVDINSDMYQVRKSDDIDHEVLPDGLEFVKENVFVTEYVSDTEDVVLDTISYGCEVATTPDIGYQVLPNGLLEVVFKDITITKDVVANTNSGGCEDKSWNGVIEDNQDLVQSAKELAMNCIFILGKREDCKYDIKRKVKVITHENKHTTKPTLDTIEEEIEKVAECYMEDGAEEQERECNRMDDDIETSEANLVFQQQVVSRMCSPTRFCNGDVVWAAMCRNILEMGMDDGNMAATSSTSRVVGDDDDDDELSVAVPDRSELEVVLAGREGNRIMLQPEQTLCSSHGAETSSCHLTPEDKDNAVLESNPVQDAGKENCWEKETDLTEGNVELIEQLMKEKERLQGIITELTVNWSESQWEQTQKIESLERDLEAVTLQLEEEIKLRADRSTNEELAQQMTAAMAERDLLAQKLATQTGNSMCETEKERWRSEVEQLQETHHSDQLEISDVRQKLDACAEKLAAYEATLNETNPADCEQPMEDTLQKIVVLQKEVEDNKNLQIKRRRALKAVMNQTQKVRDALANEQPRSTWLPGPDLLEQLSELEGMSEVHKRLNDELEARLFVDEIALLREQERAKAALRSCPPAAPPAAEERGKDRGCSCGPVTEQLNTMSADMDRLSAELRKARAQHARVETRVRQMALGLDEKVQRRVQQEAIVAALSREAYSKTAAAAPCYEQVGFGKWADDVNSMDVDIYHEVGAR